MYEGTQAILQFQNHDVVVVVVGVFENGSRRLRLLRSIEHLFS